MFRQFATYYTLFYYSAMPHWSPARDRETMSLLNWIKKMLEDYRDVEGTAYIEKRFKGLYDFFHIDTHIPAVLYQYAITIKLSSWGFGPFARSHGTITVENKTDYTKYPKAGRWHASKNKEDFPIVLWNATLSLNPGKWLPKIAAGQTIEAATTTDAFYQASDFSGADVQVTEGKVVELPININMGGTKVTTKAGIGGVVILVDGRGKKTLEFIKDLELGLPDTIEIEPSDPSAKEGTFEKIAGFLPSLTMYKGSIDTKETLTDVVSIPLPEKFDTNYQIQNTRYFKHDDATLSPQAIEAVGRLCSEELVAFSDVNSQVEIYGHTDASGKPDYNIKLSEARAANVWQAIKDRLGHKLKARLKIIKGLGEEDANKKFGEFTQKNAWLRRVVVIINGRAVLSLGEL
jgi:outer membrane protein OmpA-like peptidoglycan-associated protein